MSSSKENLQVDLGHGSVGSTSIHWLDVWLCCVVGVTLRWYAYWTAVLHLCSHRDAGMLSSYFGLFFRIRGRFFRFEFLGDQLLCVLLTYILYLSCKITVQMKVVSLFVVGVGTRLLLVLSSPLPALPLFVLRLQDGDKIRERIT